MENLTGGTPPVRYLPCVVPCKLYFTGEEKYVKNAVLAADYTMEYLYKNGIMNNEADGDDMPGFKGILARWLSKLVYEENQTKYFAWMEKNADSAWLHRNTQNLMWTAWEFPTNEFPRCAWGCSAAVAQQFACLPYKK